MGESERERRLWSDELGEVEKEGLARVVLGWWGFSWVDGWILRVWVMGHVEELRSAASKLRSIVSPSGVDGMFDC